jgi:hypothetical protein
VRARRPRAEEYRPWDRLTTEGQVAALLASAELSPLEITLEVGAEPLSKPEDWWTIVLGTGLRWFVDQLDAPAAEAVRSENLRIARDVRSVETNVIYAVAQR